MIQQSEQFSAVGAWGERMEKTQLDGVQRLDFASSAPALRFPKDRHGGCGRRSSWRLDGQKTWVMIFGGSITWSSNIELNVTQRSYWPITYAPNWLRQRLLGGPDAWR